MIQISILRERNIRRGILISVLITLVIYIIISITGLGFNGFYLYADIEFALGTIFGVIIALNNKQEDQSILGSGVIVGIAGGILSSVFLGLYEVILFGFLFAPNISVFILFFGVSVISGIVIGLIGGALIGSYYMYKELKVESEEETVDDDFYDDLLK